MGLAGNGDWGYSGSVDPNAEIVGSRSRVGNTRNTESATAMHMYLPGAAVPAEAPAEDLGRSPERRKIGYRMKSSCVFFFGLILTVPGIGRAADIGAPRDHGRKVMQEARELAQRDDFAGAVAAYQKIIPAKIATGEDIEVCMQFARLLARQGRDKAAVMEFQKILNAPPEATQKNPTSYRKARRGLFFSLINSEQYDEAERFLQKQAGQGHSAKSAEKELSQWRRTISRHKEEAPFRKDVRRTIDEFFGAIAARDAVAIGKTFSPLFPKENLEKINSQLSSSKIVSIEAQAVEISILKLAAEAKANVVASVTEAAGPPRPRTFFFKLSMVGDKWKIDSY